MVNDLEKLKKQAETDWNAQENQRDRANEDMRFVNVPGAQWEGFLDDVYSSQNGKKTRPRFQYDRLASAVRRFYAEWTTSRATIRFRPDDNKTSEREAELLDGLLRRDMRRNNGTAAIDNAVNEAATCGVGAYRITTDYVDDEEEDQLIMFEPIYSAYSSVCWDINAKRMDKADALRCTLIHEFSRDAFDEKYPDAAATSVYRDDRRSMEFSWAKRDSVFIAERYEVERKSEDAEVWLNPVKLERETYWLEDIDMIKDEMEAMGFQFVEAKKVKRRRVFKTVFSGAEILEKRREIPGRHIPIIPIYGYWCYVDGMERYSGIPTMMKDAQRLFNLQISRMAEMAASSPRRTPIMSPEQIDDPDGVIKALWQKVQYEDLPYLLSFPAYDKHGNVIASGGPLGYLEPPSLDPTSAALIEITGGYLQSETGGAPQDVLDPQASGKAINAQIARVDLNTQPIMDNIRESMKRAGEVYRWIAAEIYSAPRPVTLLDVGGEEYEARLFDVVIDQQTGTPQHIHDITKGRFEVVVDTGPGYQSKRQQTVENLKDILQSIDQNSPYYGPAMAMLIDNIDGVGIQKLKDFNRRIMLMQGIAEPEDEEEMMLVQQMQANQQPSAEEQLLMATAQREAAEAEESATRSRKNLLETEIKTMEAQQKMLRDAGFGPLEAQQQRIVFDIAKAVNEGAIQRDSGVGMLMQLFGVDQATANDILGQMFVRPLAAMRPLLQ